MGRNASEVRGPAKPRGRRKDGKKADFAQASVSDAIWLPRDEQESRSLHFASENVLCKVAYSRAETRPGLEDFEFRPETPLGSQN